MSFDRIIPTKESIKDLEKHIDQLNGEIAYYLSIAQRKIHEIDELDQVIYDLENEEYSEEF